MPESDALSVAQGLRERRDGRPSRLPSLSLIKSPYGLQPSLSLSLSQLQSLENKIFEFEFSRSLSVLACSFSKGMCLLSD